MNNQIKNTPWNGRFTERFNFLKEDQVIHVVVDHLGDDVVHKNKAKTGIEW